MTEVADAHTGVQSLPHMSPAQIDYLREQLQTSRCFLEFGAGGSTMLATDTGVATVVSVESDRVFATAVEEAVRARAVDVRHLMRYVDIGATGAWGRPVDHTGLLGWPNYSLDIWTELKAAKLLPDLVLIDGRFRAACVLSSLVHTKAETRILVDDYAARRKRYGVVERFTGPPVMVDTMAVFARPARLNTTDVALELARQVVVSA